MNRAIYLDRWRIDLTVRNDVTVPVSATSLARAIGLAADAAGAPSPASVGLILSNDSELASLNAAHLGSEGPTDVLSFPLLPPEAFPPHAGRAKPTADRPGRTVLQAPFALPPGRRQHLGDVVVSIERANEQATEGRGGQTGDVRWAAAEELRLLVTHGTLHLCGWDHADPDEETAMRALEARLVAAAR